MGGNRITVRLSDGQMARLEAHCRETDTNVTDIVHHALDAFLTPKAGVIPSTGIPARSFPPDEILTAIPKYLGWGSNDARPELRRLFTELLTCSFVLKRTFPRTPGIREVYEALRPLCRYFGMDTVRQSQGHR